MTRVRITILLGFVATVLALVIALHLPLAIPVKVFYLMAAVIIVIPSLAVLIFVKSIERWERERRFSNFEDHNCD